MLVRYSFQLTLREESNVVESHWARKNTELKSTNWPLYFSISSRR